MTDGPETILTNGRVFSPSRYAPADSGPAPIADAVAIADGRITAVGTQSDLTPAPETEVVDLNDGVILPGFVDAHTHLVHEGMNIVHADLSAATDRDDALDRLSEQARTTTEEWVIGVGFDESTWPSPDRPSREALDDVSRDRPVAAVRVDMHSAVVNTVALERYGDRIDDRHRVGGGRVVEDGLAIISPVAQPSRTETRRLVEAAIERANRRGLTGVHDKVRKSHAPRVYRTLDQIDELTLRIRIDYWSHHLDAIVETGLVTNHGSEMVTVGAIKTFTDGSIGSRTAKLSRPFSDEPDNRGSWIVSPDELRGLASRVDTAGFQLAVHAIGDDAIDETVAVLAEMTPHRHRIEHAELASDAAIDRMADAGIIASMQPNFHRWAQPDGLYDTALGPDRTAASNRLGTMQEHGVILAFGSDCMPMDPLLGIHHAVNGPTAAQSLSVTDAIRAYTHGSAYAGFNEDEYGQITVGTRADLVILDRSPWAEPTAIQDIEVQRTIVDGRSVFVR